MPDQSDLVKPDHAPQSLIKWLLSLPVVPFIANLDSFYEVGYSGIITVTKTTVRVSCVVQGGIIGINNSVYRFKTAFLLSC